MLSVTVLLSITAAPLISTNGCPWNQTARSWFSTCGEFTLQERQGRLSLYLNKSALWNVAVDVAKLILRRDGMLRKIVEKNIVSCSGVLFLPQLNSAVWVCGDVRDQSPWHFFWACRCASCDSLHWAQVEHVSSRTGCNGCYSRVKKVHLATRSSNRPEETKFSSKKKKEICKNQPPPDPFLSPWSISGGGRGGDWVCERVSDHSWLSSPDRGRHCMSGLTQIRTTHCKVSALHTAPRRLASLHYTR